MEEWMGLNNLPEVLQLGSGRVRMEEELEGKRVFFFFFLIGTLCTYPKQRRIMGVGETLSSEGNGLASPLASLSGKHAL